MESFKQAYDQSDISTYRKRAWADFMSAKSVVTARYTTSRTIHKSQGISVPCIVITNNSFYGASRSAEYVGVTRGKHGIILIDNVPNIAKGEDDE
jgi:ATP-dependent exoDNAse (exonuclease V) alpha subunit